MKNFIICLVFIFGFVASINMLYAESMRDIKEKAASYHEKATSNFVYLDSEMTAMYYQNIQIIDALEQIRDLLKENLRQMREIVRENKDQDL